MMSNSRTMPMPNPPTLGASGDTAVPKTADTRKKVKHGFDSDRGAPGHGIGQARSTEGDRMSKVLAVEQLDQQSAQGGTAQLRDYIKESGFGIDAADAEQAERHGRIQMATRDVHRGRDHDRQCDRVGECHAEDSAVATDDSSRA